jgi:hypothetical protein
MIVSTLRFSVGWWGSAVGGEVARRWVVLWVRMAGQTVEAKETVEVEAMRGRKKKRTRNTLVHVRAAQKISRNSTLHNSRDVMGFQNNLYLCKFIC